MDKQGNLILWKARFQFLIGISNMVVKDKEVENAYKFQFLIGISNIFF